MTIEDIVREHMVETERKVKALERREDGFNYITLALCGLLILGVFGWAYLGDKIASAL